MKKTISIILIAVFAAVLGSSTFYIVRHNKEADKQAELYHNLASVVEAAAQTDAEAEPTEPIPYSEEKTILPELAELFGQNGDLVGWISIADTNINYPVMQSVNEPNFYLKHGFDKEYSEYGCPYVQEDCDVQKPSDNLVIYGHHMKNGSMFAHLDKFKSESFWSEHKTIAFNTLTDRQECRRSTRITTTSCWRYETALPMTHWKCREAVLCGRKSLRFTRSRSTPTPMSRWRLPRWTTPKSSFSRIYFGR